MNNNTDLSSSATARQPQFLTRKNGDRIAYHRSTGKSPGVIFLGGFMSDMTGTKACAVEEFCQKRGNAFVRFDYTGHGQSDVAFKDGTIGRWASDAIEVIDQLSDGPQVLVGSSMGGWIMLLSALAHKDRIKGLLGLAPAPDFTEDLMKADFTKEQLAALDRDGLIEIPSDYEDEPYTITKALIEDGAQNLLLRRPIDLQIPVRLIHGQRDTDVPWRTSLKLQEMLVSEDVEVTLVKNGDHRLSEEADLERMRMILDRLLTQVESSL